MKRIALVLVSCLVVSTSRAEPNPKLIEGVTKLGHIIDDLTKSTSIKCKDELSAKIIKKQLEVSLAQDGPVVLHVQTSRYKECAIIVVSIDPRYRVWSYSKDGVIQDHGAKID